MLRVFPALISCGFLAAVAVIPASAQDVDRVAGAPGFRAPEGVRVAAPGALVFASFDRNSDGRISVAEIEAGSGAAFAAADRNGDGQVTGFEQSDWAASIGSQTDVMANTMTFDIDLDRAVTPAEFTGGLKRIAGQIQPNGELMFADLLRPLTRPSEQDGPPPGEGRAALPPRGAPPGGGRNVSGVTGQ